MSRTDRTRPDRTRTDRARPDRTRTDRTRVARADTLAAIARPIEVPASLPISSRRDELVAAIRDNQVIVVAGETG